MSGQVISLPPFLQQPLLGKLAVLLNIALSIVSRCRNRHDGLLRAGSKLVGIVAQLAQQFR